MTTPSAVMHQVTLYTKPGCGLCEEVEEVIEHVRGRIGFEMVVRNILDDLADYEKYKHDIPVVLLDGVEIARHRLTEGELEFALKRGRIQ
jgi:glutaredoxin